MYFFIFIILLLILIPSSLEKRYQLIIYLKIFISSIIYFSLLNIEAKPLLILLLTILAFSTISIMIYRLLKNNIKVKKEDEVLFKLAHEVKNPIAVCNGYLDMIDINDKAKTERYITIIKSEINRSLNIMDEFLDLKRISLNTEIMDISLLLEDVADTVRLVLGNENISFSIPDTDKEIIINGDYDKLKQVLINLIKNSYEAEAKSIKITMKINKDLVMLKVIDDGKGITKEDLNKIGTAFFTTKATGNGIGVYMSSEIIEKHHGSLSYKSEINKGTTATIILPIEYVF